MPQLEDSIVLIISSDAKEIESGTGFIVARAHGYSYLLTCAHVLEQINGKPPTTENKLKISGLDAPVDIVACGVSDGIDIALLKVAGLLDKPLFKQFMLAQEKADIKVTGYSLFDPKHGQHLKRKLEGILSHRVKIAANNQEYPFLDIAIQDDDFAKLEGGYSGSPLYNSSGHVLGVVSHKRTGEMGHAFCISNLAVLYPEIDSLLPDFKRQIEKNPRVTQIRTLLLGRLAETPEIFLKVVKPLNQIEKAGIDDNADLILQRCESFLNNEIDEAEFNDFCQSLEPTGTPSGTTQPNYPLLAQRFKNAEICLCLGTELPKLFDAKLKSAQELPQRIAALTGFAVANSRALAESCEYGELHTGCTRHSVVSELKQLLTPPPDYQPNIALFDLLVKLEKPFLVIATGFDTLLEQHLGRSKQRFVSIVTNVAAEVENQRYLLKPYNARHGDQPIPPSCSNEGLSALQLM